MLTVVISGYFYCIPKIRKLLLTVTLYKPPLATKTYFINLEIFFRRNEIQIYNQDNLEIYAHNEGHFKSSGGAHAPGHVMDPSL